MAASLANGDKADLPLINYFNASTIESPRCSSDKLVIIVKSAVQNFDSRDAIRLTWGDEYQIHNQNITTVFLLGSRGDDLLLMKEVSKESVKYKDIILGDFEDEYFSNTLKTMMGHKWAVENCDKAKHFLFVDDDYFVSVKNLVTFINGYDSNRELYAGKLSERGLLARELSKYLF